MKHKQIRNNFNPLPECDSPGDRVVAMVNSEDSPHELLYAENLVQVLLALRCHAQDAPANKVVPGANNYRL